MQLSPGSKVGSVTLEEVKGTNVCVKPGTSNEITLQHIRLEEDFNIITQNSEGGNLTNNIKLLQALRMDPDLCDFAYGNYFVLKQLKTDQEKRYPERRLTLRPYVSSNFDPLAPVLMKDTQWKNIVSYVVYALLYAEKLGITSYNLEEKRESGDPLEQRFLSGINMENIGLSRDWVYRLISKVGNYSEIYHRSIVCSYVACAVPSEQEFDQILKSIDQSRWPNKLFMADDPKPGLLYTPRF